MKILLVIDMQNDFIDGCLGSQDAIAIVDNVNNKILKYHQEKHQVIFTRDSHDQNYLQSQEGKNLPIVHCLVDTHGWKISNKLEIPKNAIIIDKNCFGYNWANFFNNYPLLLKCSEIEIIGLCTDICIISNALILKSLLPETLITVDANCCAGTTQKTHLSALDVMKMCQINIINEQSSNTDAIISILNNLSELKYKEFISNLIPNIDKNLILGVRLTKLKPVINKIIKSQPQLINKFLQKIPHTYYDENNVHGLIINAQKDFKQTIKLINDFLPFIDNWANCDLINPKIFKKYPKELLVEIKKWLKSNHAYTIRFGIKMLMTYYLNDNFKSEYLDWITTIKHSDYYVKMMIAWFFASALTKQYQATLPIFINQKLEPWTNNKAISKAIESLAIPSQHKEYLKQFKK